MNVPRSLYIHNPDTSRVERFQSASDFVLSRIRYPHSDSDNVLIVLAKKYDTNLIDITVMGFIYQCVNVAALQ